MHTFLSILRLLVAVVALTLFHLAAAFLVLVYVVIVLAVGMGRWCRDVAIRASRRPRNPRLPARSQGSVGIGSA